MTRNPNIDDQKFRFSYIQAISLILFYFFGIQFVLPHIGQFISVQFFGMESGVHPQIMMVIYLTSLITVVAIVHKPLAKSWRHFTATPQVIKTNIIEILKSWGLLYLFTIASNLIIQMILGQFSQSGNQLSVIESVKEAPVLYGFAVVVFAPIVEEIVFRGALYQQFRSHTSYKKAIILSSVIFGAIHVLPQVALSGDLLEFIHFIPYAGMSLFMIRAFEKTGSIFGAMSVHFLNNALGLIQILFLL
ncbi:CPBP family intramembrane metalloprotease [Erysipelothrix sp. HDW6C]|uniref:CPBP family intramembrane glutamic endopeptidase n=1 Tax=Erysipelothrix sp. HDW6C TaxID=2714930 RepID=UPI00140E3792|nr:type II CAAX endopeptidase family protein [Erysipelothrix sp. HDW6C]QIK70002.1 CPBP family intramembrane metalloprotease [Erysipelothrix sp. HDW6C]